LHSKAISRPFLPKSERVGDRNNTAARSIYPP